jgi:hypothetical protein
MKSRRLSVSSFGVTQGSRALTIKRLESGIGNRRASLSTNVR